MASVVAVAVAVANMNLLNEFKRHLQEGRFFSQKDRLVVAVSTGVDSMVLLDLLQRLPDQMKPTLIVAHVNHQLRQQSAQEERFIHQYCLQHGLQFACYRWPVNDHPTTGIEAAARSVRYEFFASVMNKFQAQKLVTAHHANDLAETMLMKLARGGQLNQLIGIQDQRSFGSGHLIRPLLPFSKNSLMAYAEKRQLTWFEDHTNQDLTIQRNRFRHQIIPTLENENPQLLKALWNYHQQLQTVMDQHQLQLDQLISMAQTSAGHIDLRKWPLDRGAQMGLLRRWLEHWQSVVDLKETELTRIVEAFHSSQQAYLSFSLPHHWRLIKNYDDLYVQKETRLTDLKQKVPYSVVEFDHWYSVNETEQLALSVTNHFFVGDAAKVTELWLPSQCWPLMLRPWQSDDALQLKNGGHQSIRRALINAKIPVPLRSRQMVLATADHRILTLIGIKWSWWPRPMDYQTSWRHFYVGLKRRTE